MKKDEDDILKEHEKLRKQLEKEVEKENKKIEEIKKQ